MHHDSTVYTGVNKGCVRRVVGNGIVSDQKPVISASASSRPVIRTSSEVVGETQALILRFVEKTGITVFTVAMVTAWLREQGVKITRDAVRKALERLADRGLATNRNGWWSVDVDRLVSMKVIPKKRVDVQKKEKSEKSDRRADPSTASPSTDPSSGHGVRVLGDGVGVVHGYRVVFDKVYGFVNGRFVWWISKDRGGRRLSLSDLSHFSSVSYCEVGFVPLSLQNYLLDGVFVIYSAKDVGGVVVEFRPYEGVVKKLGVDGVVKLGLYEFAEVVTGLFIDLLHYLPTGRAVELFARVVRSMPENLMSSLCHLYR